MTFHSVWVFGTTSYMNLFLLVLLLVGTVRCSVPHAKPQDLGTDHSLAGLRPGEADLLKSSQEAFRAGQFDRAAALFQRGYESAAAAGERPLAIRFLSNLGACRLAQHRTREALGILTQALLIAQSAGDRSVAGALAFNLSALYTGLGEWGPAIRCAEQALADLRGEERRRHLPKLLIHLGTLRAQQERMPEAIELFREGILRADGDGDAELYALGCSRMGEALLKRGELAQAEPALLEAFRIRKLNRLPALESSYRDLGQLRLEQGDFRSARVLLDAAVERAGRAGGPLPSWDVYQARGRALLALGRPAEALADLRTAVRLIREWRGAAPPADSTRISVESMLQQVYSALVEAGNQLYFAGGDPRLMRETFEAAEENRAASLRALLAESGRPVWTPNLLERTRAALGPEQTYISFHLGEARSYAWAVSREGVRLARLPARRTIEGQAARFRQAVETGDPAAAALGEEVFRTLFGGLEPVSRRKKHWILALEEHLFAMPFPALVTGWEGAAPVYLGVRQALQIASGAGMLVRHQPRRLAGTFLGVGDAIYNQADGRWRPHRGTAGAEAGLTRLPGSARELDACARAWNAAGGVVLLTGAAASRHALDSALRQEPAVVHFATHVVPSGERRESSSIVLSLAASGRPELLGPPEISNWRAPAGLVVLSGCSSGVAEAVPGSGLMGLTRAWLAAGAGGVIASSWPTPDDSGMFFVSVYRHLKESPLQGPAAALQKARIDMLAARSWRSQPRYWGSYFLLANQ